MILCRSRRPDDGALRERMHVLAGERRRFGYRRLHVLLRQEGLVENRKRMQRLYREERLMVRKRRGRNRTTGTRTPILTVAAPNVRWSIDFVHDRLVSGRRLRVFIMIDDSKRNAWRPWSTPRSAAPRRAGAQSDRGEARQARAGRLGPRHGGHLERHARVDAVGRRPLHIIAPGKPPQNGIGEAFNARMRDALAYETPGFSLDAARQHLARWVAD